MFAEYRASLTIRSLFQTAKWPDVLLWIDNTHKKKNAAIDVVMFARACTRPRRLYRYYWVHENEFSQNREGERRNRGTAKVLMFKNDFHEAEIRPDVRAGNRCVRGLPMTLHGGTDDNHYYSYNIIEREFPASRVYGRVCVCVCMWRIREVFFYLYFTRVFVSATALAQQYTPIKLRCWKKSRKRYNFVVQVSAISVSYG